MFLREKKVLQNCCFTSYQKPAFSYLDLTYKSWRIHVAWDESHSKPTAKTSTGVDRDLQSHQLSQSLKIMTRVILSEEANVLGRRDTALEREGWRIRLLTHQEKEVSAGLKMVCWPQDTRAELRTLNPHMIMEGPLSLNKGHIAWCGWGMTQKEPLILKKVRFLKILLFESK